MTTEQQLTSLVKANAKLIQLISYETLRIHGHVFKAAKDTDRSWYAWNRIQGVKKWNWDAGQLEEENPDCRNAEQVFRFFEEDMDDESILLLEDFHHDLRIEELGPAAINTIRRLRNIAGSSNANKTLIMSQPVYELPKELEKEIFVLDIPYPELKDIKAICHSVCEQFDLSETEISQITAQDKLMKSALGLATQEVELAFSKAYVTKNQLTDEEVPEIIAFKENIIRKSGHLEYFHPKDSIKDVGGLENLINWTGRRYKAYSDGAEDYKLDKPKGILLLGIPGTGKSLFAKAVANQWQFPLLRLDMGRIFGGIVGQSERNIRQALQVAEALAPSILWIDEIEKGLSGSGSSNETDGGTSSRVLGTFLTWMQEKESPVFVVATANNLTLPPELLRKGRIDEIFFVDLPGPESRKQIFSIHIAKKGRIPDDFDLDRLAKESKGYTGAEIQEAVKEALYRSFDEDREVNTEDILGAVKDTYPQSKVMGESLDNLRKWAKGRTVPASKEQPEKITFTEEEKKKPRLKTERSNPFIS